MAVHHPKGPAQPHLPKLPTPGQTPQGRGAGTARPPISRERMIRQMARAASNMAAKTVPHDPSTHEAERGHVGQSGSAISEDLHDEESGKAPRFRPVEEKSQTSSGGKHQPSAGVTRLLDERQRAQERGITSTDVKGLFAPSVGRSPEEDLVKELMRKLDIVRNNRFRRKVELVQNGARAGHQQDEAWLAICLEAMRDVDMQFDELERLLYVKLREAKQAVAARQVSAGAATPSLLIAADQYDRRMARARLEKQREVIRQMSIKASSSPDALNITPLIAVLQALCLDAEQSIERQGEQMQTRGEIRAAAQLDEIEARRAKTNQMITEAWRKASELRSAAMVNVYVEMRQGLELGFAAQRHAATAA